MSENIHYIGFMYTGYLLAVVVLGPFECIAGDFITFVLRDNLKGFNNSFDRHVLLTRVFTLCKTFTNVFP